MRILGVFLEGRKLRRYPYGCLPLREAVVAKGGKIVDDAAVVGNAADAPVCRRDGWQTPPPRVK
jgi:hypothetical protein